MLIDAAITFCSGAIYEIGCVLWVHHSERGEAAKTAAWAMVLALAQVTGLVESVHDWQLAPCFVIGYGVGAFAGVRWKSNLTGKYHGNYGNQNHPKTGR